MRRLVALGAVLIWGSAACSSGSDDTMPVVDTATVDTASASTSAMSGQDEESEPGDTSNPDVVSRRTTVDDVDVERVVRGADLLAERA